MRIENRGIARRGAKFSFDFEGASVDAYPGESVAAALISAGQLACRETRSGEPRGVFCGMGVCGECSVLVDGQPRRACMEMAVPGQRVTRQPALRPLPDTPAALSADLPGAAADWQVRDVDVLVIGAGPAGLAAARAAAESGAQVVLVDERSKAGGQYFKQPGLGFEVDEMRIDAQYREGLTLFRAAENAGVEFCFGATVWGAFAGPQLAITTASTNQLLNARRVVVSPGAYERPLPFPGWTLPGVMTTGAAQTLLRAYQTAPGRRVLVAGNGPLNLQVARELLDAGVDVVAVAELSPRPGLYRFRDLLLMCLTSPGLVFSGLGHLLRLTRARVPVLHGYRVCRAKGDDRVESVSLVATDALGKPVRDSEKHFAVDAVCLGYGFLAQSEIARALGAVHSLDEARSALVVDRDAVGRSRSAPEVFVPGDAGGLGGARVAIAQGALAGAQAAADLGFAPDGESGSMLERARERDQRALQRHRRFQRALWSVYAAPVDALATADAGTIICRCESVRLGDLQALGALGVSAIGAIKRETRAGMGRCQGRYCAGLLAQLVGKQGGSHSEEQSFFAPRPPFKPLTIAQLATAYNPRQVFDRAAGADRRESGDADDHSDAVAAGESVTVLNLP